MTILQVSKQPSNNKLQCFLFRYIDLFKVSNSRSLFKDMWDDRTSSFQLLVVELAVLISDEIAKYMMQYCKFVNTKEYVTTFISNIS